MIPKKIHYCWFGGNPLPELAVRCLESWKKYCPDYEIIRWDEGNYPVSKSRYMQQAYDARKWAFVSDYARLDIVYEHGGIYLDTDVEVIKSLDTLLRDTAFMGIETGGRVAFGLGFGAEARHPLIGEIRSFYDGLHFREENGTLNLTTCPEYQTCVLSRHGYNMDNREQEVMGVHIYPTEYFCPKDLDTGKIRITKNTFSIHHYDASWMTPRQRFHTKVAQIIGPTWTKRLKHVIGKA